MTAVSSTPSYVRSRSVALAFVRSNSETYRCSELASVHDDVYHDQVGSAGHCMLVPPSSIVLYVDHCVPEESGGGSMR